MAKVTQENQATPTTRAARSRIGQVEMPAKDIIVVGASAGGVEALSRLVSGLPSGLPAALFVVLHLPANAVSVLPEILRRKGNLPAVHPVDEQPIAPGMIYIAPPDKHLILTPTGVQLSKGPRENGHRPSIDVLFRSAAHSFGRRVVGIVLSGMLYDGAVGLVAIHKAGGTSIVQSPADAHFADMPRNAIALDHVDEVLPVEEIAKRVVQLANDTVDPPGASADDGSEGGVDGAVATGGGAAENPSGHLSGYTCPECHGALWEIDDVAPQRYRCRTGHAFSLESLAGQQANAVEGALWAAVRALEENVALTRKLRERAVTLRRRALLADYDVRIADSADKAKMIRSLLMGIARSLR